MDKCCFKVESGGEFVKCDILAVGKCPDKCKFRKTRAEFNKGINDAANSLIKRGLKAVTERNANGERIMTVRKWGE